MSKSYSDIQAIEEQIAKLDSKIHRIRDRLIQIKNTDISMELRLEDEIADLEGDKRKLEQEISNYYRLGTSTSNNIIVEKLIEFAASFRDDIGLLHRVNVDREEVAGRFWQHFKGIEQEAYQFHFITACSTQMPQSLSERLIYEYINEVLQEDDEGIYYPANESDERIRSQLLPLNWDLENAQVSFKRFFCEYFETVDIPDFDVFIEKGIPAIQYRSVAIIFSIEETKWKPFMEEYFEWIINTFSHKHQNVPQILFFFVTYIEDLHLEKVKQNSSIIQTLNALAKKYPTAIHLQPLQAVPDSFFRAWLREIGLVNSTQVKRIVELTVKGLDPEDVERYKNDPDKKINMADLELVQQAICDYLEKL